MSDESPKPKVSIQSFATAEKSNEGVKMEVMKPDGEPSGVFMLIRGLDSDAFQLASRVMREQTLAYYELNGPATTDDQKHASRVNGLVVTRRLIASLVADWDFEEPCTTQNVEKLFSNAPYIQNQVDNFGSKRQRFAVI